MRQAASTAFFVAFAAILVAVAAVLITLMTGSEAAVWIGGWGLIFLAPAVLSLALLCLVFGIALRASFPELSADPARAPSPILGWGLIALGVGVLTYHKVTVLLFALTVGPDMGLYALIPLFDLELPVGLAVLLYGVSALRGSRIAEHGEGLVDARLPQIKQATWRASVWCRIPVTAP